MHGKGIFLNEIEQKEERSEERKEKIERYLVVPWYEAKGIFLNQYVGL